LDWVDHVSGGRKRGETMEGMEGGREGGREGGKRLGGGKLMFFFIKGYFFCLP